MKKVGCYFILMFVLFSCDNHKGKNSNETNDSTKNVTNVSNEEDKEPFNTVVTFLKWYKRNHDEINKFELVDNAGADHDAAKSYSVNKGQTGMYLQKMKSSGFVSDLYIQEWEKYFGKCAKNLRNNPQKDGPPAGFEYDFVLFTQEIDEAMDAIDNPQLIQINTLQNKSTVKVNVSVQLTFHLSKSTDKWLIDRIENK
jgi:hypothetical protein